MSVSDWHTSKQKCIIGQIIRVTFDRTTTELRARHPRTPFVSRTVYTRGPQPQSRPDCHDTLATEWLVMLCDRLANNLPHGRDLLQIPVSLGKSLHEIKISRLTYNWFTTMPNDIRSHRVNYDQPAKTGDQRRIHLRVESLASEIDICHDRFWQLKAVVELVDFNSESARIIANI